MMYLIPIGVIVCVLSGFILGYVLKDLDDIEYRIKNHARKKHARNKRIN